MAEAQRERGVYEVPPAGPNGEVLLIVVDSLGRRVRKIEVEPEERRMAISYLWRWLDSKDPVAGSPHRALQVI